VVVEAGDECRYRIPMTHAARSLRRYGSETYSHTLTLGLTHHAVERRQCPIRSRLQREQVVATFHQQQDLGSSAEQHRTEAYRSVRRGLPAKPRVDDVRFLHHITVLQ